MEIQYYPKATKHRIRLRVQLPLKVPEGPLWIVPDAPLNLEVKGGPPGETVLLDFRKQLERIALAKHRSVLDFVRDRANQRNQCLYAANHGFLQVSWDKDAGFAKAKAWVFRTLKLYLMIDQYAQKQLFVRQGLDAFLAVLGLQQRPKGA